MNDNVLGIFFDYNIVLDSRTNRHHLVGICKTGSLSYALIITGPVMYISHEQNSIRTSEGIYYLETPWPPSACVTFLVMQPGPTCWLLPG